MAIINTQFNGVPICIDTANLERQKSWLDTQRNDSMAAAGLFMLIEKIQEALKDKIQMVCPRCGGEHIYRDATAMWDVETQTWVMSGTHDAITCDTCDYEFTIPAEKEVS